MDSGETIKTVKECLLWFYPKDIKTAVLLHKILDTQVDVIADFVGFDVPDKFVYGMGLDDNGKHRELPYVAVRS